MVMRDEQKWSGDGREKMEVNIEGLSIRLCITGYSTSVVFSFLCTIGGWRETNSIKMLNSGIFCKVTYFLSEEQRVSFKAE